MSVCGFLNHGETSVPNRFVFILVDQFWTLMLWVSLFMAEKWDQMAFKGTFQLKHFCDSTLVISVWTELLDLLPSPQLFSSAAPLLSSSLSPQLLDATENSHWKCYAASHPHIVLSVLLGRLLHSCARGGGDVAVAWEARLLSAAKGDPQFLSHSETRSGFKSQNTINRIQWTKTTYSLIFI